MNGYSFFAPTMTQNHHKGDRHLCGGLGWYGGRSRCFVSICNR